MQATIRPMTPKDEPKAQPMHAPGHKLRQVWIYNKDSRAPLVPTPGWVVGEGEHVAADGTKTPTVDVTVLVSSADQRSTGGLPVRTIPGVPIVAKWQPQPPTEVRWPASIFAMEVA